MINTFGIFIYNKRGILALADEEMTIKNKINIELKLILLNALNSCYEIKKV